MEAFFCYKNYNPRRNVRAPRCIKSGEAKSEDYEPKFWSRGNVRNIVILSQNIAQYRAISRKYRAPNHTHKLLSTSFWGGLNFFTSSRVNPARFWCRSLLVGSATGTWGARSAIFSRISPCHGIRNPKFLPRRGVGGCRFIVKDRKVSQNIA